MVKHLTVAAVLLSGCLRFSAKPAANQRPIALLTQAEYVVAPRETIVLDAEPSNDADGDRLTYHWEVVASTDAVVVKNPDARTTTLTVPDRGQRVYVQLVVNDGALSSEPALVGVRVNTPPRASAGPTRVGAAPLYLDGDAEDQEGDEIASYAWSVVSAPAAGQICVQDPTACFDDVQSRTPNFSPPALGIYRLALRAADDVAVGVASETVVEIVQGNRAPVLSLSRTSEVRREGEPFSVMANASDLDGDPLVITWHKLSGPSGFADVLVGPSPAPIAPAFLSLLGNTNVATYEVIASDGDLQSAAATVQLFSAPGSGFVIVSSRPEASDTSPCGTMTAPCRTIGFALREVDPDANGLGDGRQLVVTTGFFTERPPSTGLAWKGNVSLYGGRDPVTFEYASHSSWQLNADQVDASCVPNRVGVLFSSNSVGIEIQGVDITHTTAGCINGHHTLSCAGCSLRLFDTDIRATGADGGSSQALVVNNGSVTIERSKLVAANAFNFNRALLAEASSNVTVRDSTLETVAQSPSISGADMSALRSNGSSITVEASSLRVVGGAYNGTANGQPTSTVWLNGGSFTATNTDLVQRIDGAFYNVYAATATATTLINCTLAGPQSNTGSGASISSPGAVGVMNSVFTGQRLALDLRSAPATGSQIYGNVLSGVDTALACPGATLSTGADLNAAAGTTCNTSSQAWSNNQAGVCTFVAASSFDYRLETSGANDCVDAGVASSPVGLAAATDQTGVSRPLGQSPDAGSHEGG